MIERIDFSLLATVAAESLAKLAAYPDQILARRWSNAIYKALEIMRDTSGNRPVTRAGANGALIMLSGRASGRAYYADGLNGHGVYPCEAAKVNQPCWHCAAARLVMRHDERMAERLHNRNVA